jgi:hypothetical protein
MSDNRTIAAEVTDQWISTHTTTTSKEPDFFRIAQLLSELFDRIEFLEKRMEVLAQIEKLYPGSVHEAEATLKGRERLGVGNG